MTFVSHCYSGVEVDKFCVQVHLESNQRLLASVLSSFRSSLNGSCLVCFEEVENAIGGEKKKEDARKDQSTERLNSTFYKRKHIFTRKARSSCSTNNKDIRYCQPLVYSRGHTYI